MKGNGEAHQSVAHPSRVRTGLGGARGLGIKWNPRRRPWRWGGVRELLELELEVRGGLWTARGSGAGLNRRGEGSRGRG